MMSQVAISKIIKDLGFQICCSVTSCKKALYLLDIERTDIVVMNTALKGGLDGIETARVTKFTTNI